MTQQDHSAALSRRAFLATVGGGVTALVMPLFFSKSAAAATSLAADAPPQPDAFIQITEDNRVIVINKFLDMGQGIGTGMATLIAEEMDADWQDVSYVFAPADAAQYTNSLLGVQGVGNSTSIAGSHLEMRRAGAAARRRLVWAAAQMWDVPEADVTISNGMVAHATSDQRSRFGALIKRAAEYQVYSDITLKDAAKFNLIGNETIRRTDQTQKNNGSEIYGLDKRLEGMLFAVIARPAKFGARLARFDASEALKIKDVVEAFDTGMGVAVVAKNSWAAIKGRAALTLEWDESDAETRSSVEIMQAYRTLAQTPGVVAGQAGNVDTALDSAARIIDAEFEFPLLAHAPLEPLNATVQMTDTGAEVWLGSQFQTVDQAAIADVLQTAPNNVELHTLMAGGSFGRRANPVADYTREAALVAAKSQSGKPIQTMWTRQDDLAGGFYRSQFFHKVRASLTDNGMINAWDHRIVGQSIADGTAFEPYMVADGVDYSSVEGARDNIYGVPHFRCDLHTVRSPVPVLWWRSVGHTHTTYAVETMMDDLAAMAGVDPLAFRLSHLSNADPRLVNVLERAAEAADWGSPPEGRSHGLAVCTAFNSFTAQVAEVSVDAQGQLTVHRMIAAVDCGTPINPDNIRAQVEGSIAFGMTGLFYGAITLEDGQVAQENFDTYPLLRYSQMPQVETVIIPSTEPPTGIGEPPVPVVAPAISNAYFAATGTRLRTLPFSKAGIV